jgi:hypothetical protein
VLRSEGFIFIETLGSHHTRELPKPNGMIHEGTLLTSLEIERDRFRRHGIEPKLLMGHISTLRFKSIYNHHIWIGGMLNKNQDASSSTRSARYRDRDNEAAIVEIQRLFVSTMTQWLTLWHHSESRISIFNGHTQHEGFQNRLYRRSLNSCDLSLVSGVGTRM